MIKIPVRSQPTSPAKPLVAMQVYVWAAEKVAALAVRLSLSFGFGGSNRFDYGILKAGVKSLLTACGPAAIGRFVVAVVVDSVKGVGFGRWVAHVSNEVCVACSAWHRSSPAVANADPAPSPILEVRAVLVLTPGNHVCPSPV